MSAQPAAFHEIPGTEEYLAVALQAMRVSEGSAALDQLGYWDMLTELGDRDARAAAFAVFRAQGRQLASSSALGGLLAQPYLDASTGSGSTSGAGAPIATVTRRSSRRGTLHMIVGDLAGRHVVADRPGNGVVIVPSEAVTLQKAGLPGRISIHEAVIDWDAAEILLAEPDAVEARRRSVFLGRLALTAEILGAAEGVTALAQEYAMHREQFGHPIGRFQAIRHLLAWASTDCVAIESVLLKAVFLDEASPPMFGEIAKALAGRNGRKVCERALQALGGIGFTAEHDHHHHHQRILALDSLLGTSAELTHELGAWLRTSGTDPQLATSVLRPPVK